jgi:hypothetical protein
VTLALRLSMTRRRGAPPKKRKAGTWTSTQLGSIIATTRGTNMWRLAESTAQKAQTPPAAAVAAQRGRMGRGPHSTRGRREMTAPTLALEVGLVLPTQHATRLVHGRLPVLVRRL